VLNVLAEHAVSALVSAKRYEQTRELSLTDPLTGLANGRGLFHHLELLCSRWKNCPADQFAVLMMDLDGFKQVNDTRGHLAGDNLLREFAEILRRLSREEDLVCRYAGDEFVVVLSQAGPETAQTFVRRVREAFSRSASELGPVSVAVSVGTACYPVDGRDGPALLAAADERMYGDKFRRRALPRSVAELEER
jgi:diguanylate cyclase (GGDEF)-like protein